MDKKWLPIVFLILGIGGILIGILGLILQGFPQTDTMENVNHGAVRPLPIPILLSDDNEDPNISDYNIRVKAGLTNFYGDALTPTLGYNGSFLGPVIKMTRGETIQMHILNDLDAATSVHWHGLEVIGTEDGGPHQVIEKNTLWEPSFKIDQPAATLWFHPHVIGTTASQVYYGLAGLIIIEDDFSKALNLPDEYGVNDIPLIIQDRSFKADGSFSYQSNMMDGAIGDKILVNGAITPVLHVKQVKMRFRIVNGANARNFKLMLSDKSDFHQIASDGGFLEKPLTDKALFIAPGERAEIIIDFSKYKKGDTINLISYDNQVMNFTVGEPAEDLTVLPKKLVDIKKMDESMANSVKTIKLDGMGHMVSLNGRKFDMNRIDDHVELGQTEIWAITTSTSMMGNMGHPFHIHGTQFQVLSRNNKPPKENEKGWKDTVFVGPDETVRVIVKFRYEGVFMYHCHILEHEEAGMMGQLEVIQ